MSARPGATVGAAAPALCARAVLRVFHGFLTGPCQLCWISDKLSVPGDGGPTFPSSLIFGDIGTA